MNTTSAQVVSNFDEFMLGPVSPIIQVEREEEEAQPNIETSSENESPILNRPISPTIHLIESQISKKEEKTNELAQSTNEVDINPQVYDENQTKETENPYGKDDLDDVLEGDDLDESVKQLEEALPDNLITESNILTSEEFTNKYSVAYSEQITSHDIQIQGNDTILILVNNNCEVIFQIENLISKYFHEKIHQFQFLNILFSNFVIYLRNDMIILLVVRVVNFQR